MLPGGVILIFYPILNNNQSHLVCHIVFEIYMSWQCYCICHVLVVSGALGDILFSQEQYEEALQMYGKEHDILVKVSPNSEAMAHGRQ